MAAKHLPNAYSLWKPRKKEGMLSDFYRVGIVDAHEVAVVGRNDTWAGPVGQFLASFVPVNPEEAFA